MLNQPGAPDLTNEFRNADDDNTLANLKIKFLNEYTGIHIYILYIIFCFLSSALLLWQLSQNHVSDGNLIDIRAKNAILPAMLSEVTMATKVLEE